MSWIGNIIGNLISFFIIAGILVLIGIFLFKRRKKKDDIDMKEVNRVVVDVTVLDEKKNDFGLGKAITIEDLKKALSALAEDDDIKEVALDLNNYHCNLAQAYQLDPYFEKIRAKKPLKAYASMIEMKDYLCALPTDSIYLMDSKSAHLSLESPSSATMYFKKILDKIGIRMHVLHVGAYKGTGENYNRETMSPERRESVQELQNQTLSVIEERVEKYRHISIREDLCSGKWYFANSSEAIAEGLIDGLVPYMDMPRNNENKTVSISRYYSEKHKEKQKKKQDEILVLPLIGTIREQEGLNDTILLSQIRQIKEHENAKGIVLYVDSPGGSALESEKMYQRIKTLNLPVYVSQGEVAASGGYYISCAASKIYATPFTITGSIGVVSMIPDVSEAVSKLDIHVETENKGDYSTFNPLLPLDELTEGRICESMLQTYNEFKDRVKAARKMDEQVLEPLAGGRVYLGQKAKEIGLVDEVGSLDDCIEALAKELNLSSYVVKTIYKKQDLQDRFPLPLNKLSEEALFICSQTKGIQTLETIQSLYD